MSELANAVPVSFVLTGDRASARHFYADTLGLPIAAEDDFAITFALAGGTLMRLTDVEGHKAAMHTVLGWNVDDIVEAAVGLAGKGVEFRVYPGMGQDENGIWQAPGGGAKVAWFTDPDGNVLSLTQFGPGMSC